MAKIIFSFFLLLSAAASQADSNNFTCREIDGKKMVYFMGGQLCGTSYEGDKDDHLAGVKGICLQEVECAYGPNGMAKGNYYPSTIVCPGKREEIKGKYYNTCPSAGDCKADNVLVKKEMVQKQDGKILIEEKGRGGKGSSSSSSGG